MFIKLKQKLSGLFSTEGTLSQKAARGGVWVLASFGFKRLCFFIRTIILVRLLAPEDFGLMGITLLATGILVVFTQTGMGAAIIQRKKYDKDALSTAWVISVVRGFVLFAALFFSSPLFAKFYENPQIEPLLKVISFSFLFSGISNIGIILFQKELDFKKKVIYEQITNFSNIIFSIIFAFIFRNVWALVLGHVIGTFVGGIGSYFIHPFRPSFKFKPNIAKELLHFGKHVFGASATMFIITQGDDALVGKVLGLSALGFYVLAYNLSNMPATAITHVISQVSFPAYSKVQDDLVRLERGYLKVLKFTSLLAIPLAGGIFILAPEFIRIVYGEKWAPMIPAVLVMCFLGFFRSIAATMGPIFYAVGKPYIVNKIKLCELILMVIIIYPLTKTFGIVGAAITGTLVYLLSLILHYHNLINIIKSLKLKILKVISKPLGATLLMIISIYLIKNYIFVSINLSQLISLILFGLAFYFRLSLVFDKKLFKSTKEIINSLG